MIKNPIINKEYFCVPDGEEYYIAPCTLTNTFGNRYEIKIFYNEWTDCLWINIENLFNTKDEAKKYLIQEAIKRIEKL